MPAFQASVFAQLSTIGREFFVGFMENNRIVPNRIDQATLIISASENANGFIRYQTNTHQFSIQAGQQFVFDFPRAGLDIIHRSSGQVEDLGVYIFSDGNIAVHAFNFRERSADGTVVLPLSSLGKQYLLTAHYEEFAPGVTPGSNINYESTMLVVAVEDDTDIEITTTAPTVNTIPPGAPINISLNKGQSYQIKARGDLTGTKVRVLGSQDGDCKNIAVFGGNKMTSVGRDCEGTTGDHLYQQAYPIFTWGTEYIHIPFKARSSGDMVKVLAADNDTEVFVNGVSQGRINSGKFLTFNFGPEELANIRGSKPISVTTFAKSQWCNIQNGPFASNGDPSMVTLSPNPQLIKQVSFSAVRVVGIVNHYLNVIARRGTENLTFLDGQAVGSQFGPVPGNSDYSYAQIEIQEGVHTLSNAEGVIGYVYGSGFIESYAYSAGASLENLNFKTEVDYPFEVEGDKVACLGHMGSWNVIPLDPKFQIFEWTFGDRTVMREGNVVEHLFETPGTYEIKITAFTGDRACDQIQEAVFKVEVIETKGELSGPETVCPLIDEATYIFENIQNVAKVRWEVVGGEVVWNDDYSAKINWGPSNPDAKVKAIPLTEQGCEGESQEISVLVTEAIEPGLPRGQALICFGVEDSHTYRVKDILPNRGYEWYVTGGSILSGQSSPELVVEWAGVGTTGEVWYREFSLQNPACDGISPKLLTSVHPSLEARMAFITPEICEGSSLGRIMIDASGGTEAYRFKWSHDPNLDNPLAEGLPIGTYSVSVSDGGGCEIVFENLEIKASEPLEVVGLPEVTNATCFDAADGSLSFEIKGGTKPYRVVDLQAEILGGEIQVFGLERGDHQIEVRDAVGCSFFLSAIVDSPSKLSIAFEIERFACGGLANGTLLARADGGITPYIFSWDLDASSDTRLDNIAAGIYGVTVQDQNGCQATALAEMKNGAPVLRMPSGFDPSKGRFEGISNCQVDFKLMIFNKWGQLIFVGSDGWDGKIDGNDAPLGTYTFLVEYTFDIDGARETLQQRGAVTLIR